MGTNVLVNLWRFLHISHCFSEGGSEDKSPQQDRGSNKNLMLILTLSYSTQTPIKFSLFIYTLITWYTY